MMSFEDIDFQFLDEGNLFDIGKGFAGSDLDLEPENPVLGSDPNLASVLNSDYDFLAYTSTDQWATSATDSCEGKTKTQNSPWHESDSGMSDATYEGSPQSYTQEEDVVRSVESSSKSKLNSSPPKMDHLALDDLDVDVENCDQLSPTNNHYHYDYDPSENRNRAEKVESSVKESDFDSIEENHKNALEFFKSSDLFSKSCTVRVLNVHNPVENSEQDTEGRSRKNAIQAKINREKKKAYIKNLEGEVQTLKDENTKLSSENCRMQKSVTELEEEVDYLKSVLMNSSSLSSLLKNIPNVKDVKLSATIIGRKRSSEDDHSYNIVESVPEKRARRINENLRKAGVCLHVVGGSACLEFCAHCSKLAQKSSVL